MHMHAAGSAIPAPTIILVAIVLIVSAIVRTGTGLVLTNVAPDERDFGNIMVPNNRVDAVDDVDDKEPGNHRQRCDVSRSPVPWQGNRDKKGSKEGYVGKFGVHCRRRGGSGGAGGGR